MESVVQICLGILCVFTPILFLLWTGLVYGMGIGSIKIPGVGREKLSEDKEWTTVPDLTRKVSEGIAAIFGLLGTLFGLIGFLLPWVQVNVGAGASMLDLGNFNGTLSGIALAFQSLVAGFGIMGSDIDGAMGIGIALILVSLLVWLIPIALLISALVGAGLISVPLGLVKIEFKKLARILLISSIISICLSCTFFAGIQATVGGIKLGGSEGIFGSSVEMGVEMANGFWVTFGGLILSLIGAVVASSLAASYENWSKNLVTLKSASGAEAKEQ